MIRWLQPRYNLAAQAEKSPSPPGPQPRRSLVWVALSGGGTRAAAFGWEVLQALRQVPFPDSEGEPSTLAAEIDYMSGISGGSFAAAAWCHLGPDSVHFRRRFLERNIQRSLGLRQLLPRNIGRLPSRRFSRTHVAAELYDRQVFEGGCFGDLPRRPQLRIHATNLALGARFSFTPEDFALIGSDLAGYPLGHACAASSAFPVLLAPMTLLNHGKSRSLDELYATDPAYEHAVDNAALDVEWHYRRLAREYYNDKSNRFIHLADGGLVDNQGLQAILDEFDTFGLINDRLADFEPPLERLVLINVNAGTRSDDTVGRKARAPGMIKVMLYTMVTSMDLLSAKRWIRIQEQVASRRAIARRAQREGRSLPLADLEIYAIEISLRNVKDEVDRADCQKLPTSFRLTPKQLDLVRRVTPELVSGHPELQRLRRDVPTPGGNISEG